MDDLELIYKADEDTVSRLAGLQNIFLPETAAFFASLFGTEKTCVLTQVKYIKLPDKRNMFATSKIFIRSCYEHLSPHVQNAMDICFGTGFRRIAITGSPGIGKTVFGALLTRMYVLEKRLSVVYWERDNIYLFSWEEGVKTRFGLKALARSKGSVLYCGFWQYRASESFLDLLIGRNTIVIHDPKLEFCELSLMVDHIHRIIFVLSYDHSLIQHWRNKDLRPQRYFYVPLWTECESNAAFNLWQMQPNPDNYTNFGGCIHGWLHTEMLTNLNEKAKEVVEKNGSGILGRTKDTKGSLVHLHVDFDESKAKQPLAFSRAALTADPCASSNTFEQFSFVFGSSTILRFVDAAIMAAGAESLERCVKTWADQDGFESIHGGLYELHCHRLLTRDRQVLTLRARKVFQNDGDNTNDIFTIKLPVVSNTISRYKSNYPSILGSDEYASQVETGRYFWPLSSNHPTYDSAMLVQGDVVGLPADQMVPLLLQMTVSGASGLPRQPKHAVKQYVRKKFDEAFRKHLQSIAPGITTFLVPTVCFERFLFQYETTKDDDDIRTNEQPDYQLVVEIPDEFNFTAKADSFLAHVSSISVERKRVHRYSSALR